MFKVFVFSAMVGIVFGATSMSLLPPKPPHLAHKEGCYIEEIDDVVPFGTILTGPQCVRISCGGMIDYATCGVVITKSPCYVTKGDDSKQYPDCCPKVKCENDNYV